MTDYTVKLPTLHPTQVDAYQLFKRDEQRRHLALRCGRRWGKTDLFKVWACDGAIKGEPVGWFAPDYKRQNEAWNEIVETLAPIERSKSRQTGVLRTITGGRIDFWTLKDEAAGRSRKYKRVIVDEAAFTRPFMMHTWETAIGPTLIDYDGRAMVGSTPKGIDTDNFFWRVCNEPMHGFVEYHAPTSANPYMPAKVIEKARREKPPLVFRQEYLAEFVSWDGVQFFELARCLVAGEPVPLPAHCDSVFATIDTAVKTGKKNDGTAVIYWARNQYVGTPLLVLDWEILQIEGSLLETWLPTVFANLENFAKVCKSRGGSAGVHIEDKSSGMILLQQAKRHGWDAYAIDSKLTSVGKDERAISVSGNVYREEVKISRPAYEKVSGYKERTKNHMLEQVFTFRLGDPDTERSDDLLDCWTYGISVALGDNEGF